MNYEIVIPVLISFAISAHFRTDSDPFFETVKGGADRAERVGIPFEEKWNPDYGWTYDTGKYHHYLPVLCQRLSENYPNPFYDRRIRCDRIFWMII